MTGFTSRTSGGQEGHGMPKANAHAEKELIIDLTCIGNLALWDKTVCSREPTLWVMV